MLNMVATTLASSIQNMPIDADDIGSVATVILLQIMATAFGDDLFKTIVGFSCLLLVLLSGCRIAIKIWKEYQQARTIQLQNQKLENHLDD